MMCIGKNVPNIFGRASEDVDKYPQKFTGSDGTVQLVDDCLSEEELAFIVGMYSIYTSEFT